MTKDLITRYVERRNVTVTWVTIFPIKNSHQITIRLNVEENNNADNVTEDWFWPRNVTCRPWESWNSYKTKMDNRRHSRQNDRAIGDEEDVYTNGHTIHRDSSYYHGNRYSDNAQNSDNDW